MRQTNESRARSDSVVTERALVRLDSGEDPIERLLELHWCTAAGEVVLGSLLERHPFEADSRETLALGPTGKPQALRMPRRGDPGSPASARPRTRRIRAPAPEAASDRTALR